MTITQEMLTRWQNFINSGNRAGFYYEYYKESGQYQALIQASITSYSGAIGGLALVGNYMAKIDDEQHYGLTLDDFSTQIAKETFDNIKDEVEKGNSGYLTETRMANIDRAVWISHDMGDLFPGNLQFLLNESDWETSYHVGFRSGASENIFDAVYSPRRLGVG